MADTITNLKVRIGADTKQFKKGVNEGKQSMKSFSKEGGSALESFANQFGVSLGPLKGTLDKSSQAFRGMNASMKSAGAGAGFLTKAMKLLKVAIISTGIGALVVLIASVVTAFSRFQDKSDALSTKLAGLKAVVNVVLDRLGRLGEAVLSLLKGDFKAAADSLKQAFQGVGDEMLREYDIALKLKELSIDLERRSKLFEAEKETAFSEINNLRALSKDKLANDKERLAAIIEAGKLEQQISERSLTLAEEELAAALDSYDVEKQKLGLNKEGAELIERIRKGQIGSLEAQEMAKNLTIDDANAKDTLFNLVDKIVNREKEQQRIIQTRLRIQNAENTVRQEIMLKEITSLNAQAKLKQEMAKEDNLNFAERKKLIEEGAELEQQALKVALDGNKITREQYLAETLMLARSVKDEVESLTAEIDAKYEEIKKKRLEEQGDLSKPLDSIELTAPALEIPDLETDKLISGLKTGLGEAEGIILDFSQMFNDTFSGLAYSFGEQMGNIIAGSSSFQDFGNVILGAMGDLAIKIGKMAISTGAAVAGIKKALTSMNPYVAIAAGVALVALGYAIKSSLASAASGSGGGGSISDNSFVFDSRGTTGEFGTTQPNAQSQGQTVNVNVTGEFRQRGSELVATISETQKRDSYNR